jgi:hypothetical protein
VKGSKRPHLRVLLALALVLGCRGRPAAPILSDSHVYQNAEEGFRFLVPDGWRQSANSSLPPGPLHREPRIVRYTMTTDQPGAVFVVLCTDDSPALDVESHHAGPSFGADHWNIVEPRTQIEVRGVPAERMEYKANIEGQTLTKFVTGFRRHGRVYSFVGLFASTDATARQQVDRATHEIIWTR